MPKSPLDAYRKKDPMSQATKQKYPDMDLAWLQMQSQMPKEAGWVNSLRPMNWLEQHLAAPGAQATTLPWGTILFNPQNYSQNVRPDDLIAHELTHAGQIQQHPYSWFLSTMMNRQKYSDRSYEGEAFATEAKRKAKRKDIPLKPKR